MIGIGINIVSNPIIVKKYKATNIFLETKKKPKVDEIIKLIKSSYENFFLNINSYNFLNFKNKAQLMAIN